MQSHLFVCAQPIGIPASGDNPPSVCNNNKDPKYAWDTNDRIENCYRPIMAMNLCVQPYNFVILNVASTWIVWIGKAAQVIESWF